MTDQDSQGQPPPQEPVRTREVREVQTPEQHVQETRVRKALVGDVPPRFGLIATPGEPTGSAAPPAPASAPAPAAAAEPAAAAPAAAPPAAPPASEGGS